MKANVFYLSASASVAEGLRPKLLAEGLGHIFGKIFKCNRQSVLITISFLQFFYFRSKNKFHSFVKYVDYLEIEDFTGKDVVLLKLCRQISSIFQLFETFGFGFGLQLKAEAILHLRLQLRPKAESHLR